MWNIVFLGKKKVTTVLFCYLWQVCKICNFLAVPQDGGKALFPIGQGYDLIKWSSSCHCFPTNSTNRPICKCPTANMLWFSLYSNIYVGFFQELASTPWQKTPYIKCACNGGRSCYAVEANRNTLMSFHFIRMTRPTGKSNVNENLQ